MLEELQTQEGVTATPPVADASKEQPTSVENPPAEESQPKEEENKIPLSRVKEMLARAKEDAKKEFTKKSATTTQESAEPTEEFKKGQDYVRMLIQSEMEPFKAQIELYKTMTKYPDLPKFKEDMIARIKEDPNLSYENAYKLSKYDSLHQDSYETGKKEAIQNIQAKRGSAVETQKVKTSPKLDLDSINIMDKTISLADIEKLLPHG